MTVFSWAKLKQFFFGAETQLREAEEEQPEWLLDGDTFSVVNALESDYHERLYELARDITTAVNRRGIRLVDVASIRRAAFLLDPYADICGDPPGGSDAAF